MEGIFAEVGLWLGELGGWAYVIAPLVMAVVAILPVPAEAPAMANGMLFGVVEGSLVTWTGAMLGAWISYEIAQRWGRALAVRLVPRTALDRVDGFVERVGWWGLLVARLIRVIALRAQ